MLGGFAFPTVAFCRPSCRRAVGYGAPTWRCLQKLGHGYVAISCLIRCTIPAPTPHSRAVLWMPLPAARDARIASSTFALVRARPIGLPLFVTVLRALAIPA